MHTDDPFESYRLIAPDIDRLLHFFDGGIMNPATSTPALVPAVEPLFQMLSPVVPIDRDGEVKSLWLRIPRGSIGDYDSFEDMRDWGDVETYEEYLAHWLEDYPDECSWHELVVIQSLDRDGSLYYFSAELGNHMIISASMDPTLADERRDCYEEAAACKLCSLLLPAARESMGLLVGGTYNSLVASSLPYQFRTGVIRRSDLWEVVPDAREADLDGLSDEQIQRFRKLVESGANSEDAIGRIREFTANGFFRACKLGYESIGKSCEGLSLPEIYRRFSDGRDEGLTGGGCGLNAGQGIDFESPRAWDEWYFHRTQRGGHPWEVVRGGNSTHVELYVMHDRRELEWDLRRGTIAEAEFEQRMETAGYYFVISGLHRQYEAVSFYLALHSAGLPVVIRDARKLLARFLGTDWVGVVPHHVFTRYCSDLFPDEYGDVIDFTHVYKDEDAWFDHITWLPERQATLVGHELSNSRVSNPNQM